MPETSGAIEKTQPSNTESEQSILKPEHRLDKPPARFDLSRLKKGEKQKVSKQIKIGVIPELVKPDVMKNKVSIKQIEQVLSSDLEDAYFQMSPDVQQKFKKAGEQTAQEIKGLLEKTKINVKKIANLIINWLKIIPGVNKFFLEQEGKIKTDNILRLKKDGRDA